MSVRVISDGSTRTLVAGGIPSSQIDLADPTRLEFPYMRRIADVLDVMAPAGRPLRSLHLGAGLGALARYLQATRPGSSSDLVDLVRHVDDLDVELADARAALERRAKRSYDVVIGDVFDGPVTPRHLTTREYLAEVRRVLRPGGVYAVNLIDDPPQRQARRMVATLVASFAEAVLLAERPVLAGRRTGDLVVAAADRTLPVAKLAKRSHRTCSTARASSCGARERRC